MRFHNFSWVLGRGTSIRGRGRQKFGVSQLGGGVPPLPPEYAYDVGVIEVRTELDKLVVLYKSVCSVTVSIGEISFSLLARLETWEWGGGEAGLLQPDYAVC